MTPATQAMLMARVTRAGPSTGPPAAGGRPMPSAPAPKSSKDTKSNAMATTERRATPSPSKSQLKSAVDVRMKAVLAGTMTASPTTPYPHCIPVLPAISVASPIKTSRTSGWPAGSVGRPRRAWTNSQGPTTRTDTHSLLQTAQIGSHRNSASRRMQTLAAPYPRTETTQHSVPAVARLRPNGQTRAGETEELTRIILSEGVSGREARPCTNSPYRAFSPASATCPSARSCSCGVNGTTPKSRSITFQGSLLP